MKKGFTLVEILIVIMIVGVIIGFSAYWFIKATQSKFSLDETAEYILLILKIAREKSIIGEENSIWGVYLVNSATPPDRIYIFQNDTNNLKDSFELPNEISFFDFSTKTVTFQKLSGITTSTFIKIGSVNSNDFRYIVVPTSGAFYITSTQP